MGDPKKPSKKYSLPSHPWQKSRLEEEIRLKKEYGLRNKKEIYKIDSAAKSASRQAKKLITLSTDQAVKEKQGLLTKLTSYGLIEKGADLNAVLSLTAKEFMERRLQTVVFRKGLARSMKAARQLILHKHISIGGKPVSVPSYMVAISEEPNIAFTLSSPMFDSEHPERVQKKPEVVPDKEEK